MRSIVLIGGGGHCKTIVDSLKLSNEYKRICIVDPDTTGSIFKVPILGTDDDLKQLFNDGYHYAFISKGSIGNAKIREKLFLMVEKIGFKVPTIIDKTAVVSQYARLSNGIYVGKGAVIGADAIIGKGAIINTSVVVEHECYVGKFVHLATAAVLAGNVKVGDYTHIGANAVVRNGITIGDNVMIGIGSVVTKNIDDGLLAYGNPCRIEI